MNSPNYTKIAIETWELCQQLLPRDVGWAASPHPKDPSPLAKKGYAPVVTRMRILPEPKQPVRFWSSAWCFYEILIGPVDGGTNLGGIQFLQFSDQEVCGKSHWYHPVMATLRELQAVRPNDFILTENNSKGVRKPQLCTRYRMSPKCKAFPVGQAAADLAWLIRESLPRFNAFRLGNLATSSSSEKQI